VTKAKRKVYPSARYASFFVILRREKGKEEKKKKKSIFLPIRDGGDVSL